MSLISEGATLHEHAWVAHELDLERKSWPLPGDKRICLDCGAVMHRCRTPFGDAWVPSGYTVEYTIRSTVREPA